MNRAITATAILERQFRVTLERRLFVEKIVNDEKAQKYSRTAEQDILIYYQNVRLMDTPVECDFEEGDLMMSKR